MSESRHTHIRTDHKTQSVLRVLKGDDPTQVASEIGVSIERLERWQTRFLDGGRAAMAAHKKSRGGSGLVGKTVGQWAALIVILVITVLILVKFISRDAGQ